MLQHRFLLWSIVWAGLIGVPAIALAQAAPATKAQPAPSSLRWSSLTGEQRQALRPLAAQWASLSDAQRRKWIALSRNFAQLPLEEQRKLQQRMGEWVKLSPAERSLARLNFAETERIASNDKQALWEAYQALSEEERRKLAEQAPRRPLAGGATAVRPIPRQRLATMPVAPENRGTMPRIATATHLINPATLLPQIDAHSADVDPAPKP